MCLAPMAAGTHGGDDDARGENAASVGKWRWDASLTADARRLVRSTISRVGLGDTASRKRWRVGDGPSGRWSSVATTHFTAATAADTGVAYGCAWGDRSVASWCAQKCDGDGGGPRVRALAGRGGVTNRGGACDGLGGVAGGGGMDADDDRGRAPWPPDGDAADDAEEEEDGARGGVALGRWALNERGPEAVWGRGGDECAGGRLLPVLLPPLGALPWGWADGLGPPRRGALMFIPW